MGSLFDVIGSIVVLIPLGFFTTFLILLNIAKDTSDKKGE